MNKINTITIEKYFDIPAELLVSFVYFPKISTIKDY